MLARLSTVSLAAAALACLLAAVAIWRGSRAGEHRALVIAALGASAVHLLASSPHAVDVRALWLVTALRNLAWLLVLRAQFAVDGRHASLRPVRPVIAALALAELLQVPLVVLSDMFTMPGAFLLIERVSNIFHLLFVVGMLVLVHNLYIGAGAQQRLRLGAMAGALVVAWGYELNVFAIQYLSGRLPDAVVLGRAMAWTVVATLVWMDARRKPVPRFAPSRTVAFQSLSLLVIALYLFALFAVDGALAHSDAGLGALSRFGAVVMAVFVGALLASSGFRAWLREAVARNFFRHRYDYRAEWLRLSGTIAGSGPDEPSTLEQRAVQSLADIVDSPSGLLLTPSEDGEMSLSARWNWELEVPAAPFPAPALALFADDRSVVALDGLRDRPGLHRQIVPGWLLGDRSVWAMVPLQVADRITGVVVLARPVYARRLDWEDFDMMRIVGQQLAAHLAENAAQKQLLDAARFDEFNRRMAFVMHDIKNLASQLGLLVSNAERHIEKPAFRADMLVTLRSATDRMETLLGRLSNYRGSAQAIGGRAMEPLRPADVVAKALSLEIASGLVIVHDGGTAPLLGDGEALDRVIRHLARNAIEASAPGRTVEIRFPSTDRLAAIAVEDFGCGMSPEFVRSNLFKPFVSTKADGFGIGAFEARELIRAMGGRLEVDSRVGHGSRFTIWLPRAEAATGNDRKVA
ncbi:XrtA/PEP-CTERM system histidine kinase PrsK [Croceicoccus sp. BE223]|uniref:XrtA/PEP-CTERM system histidine kinase PrsK n=1 Tax=Croceicoccus sp. BE223 TaxID=2817716 RepID=UPI002857BBEA|nr:XrtA/PEP-CTERM system histidine kinase PrsK [Croceicoccus sp. BE223]MDR7103110.1 putative PEP-CTERM system histidine kinase [Croceicoccus sp. BE223]